MHLADAVYTGSLIGKHTLQATTLFALQAVSQTANLRSCSQFTITLHNRQLRAAALGGSLHDC